VGYVELDIKSPADILHVSPKPVLEPGPLGYFDDHGVYAASIVEHDNKLFMYYIGWNPGRRRPLFYSSIGLALSEDMGVSFRKISPAPIMARSEFDPCLVTSPCVIKDNNTWKMWYVSGLGWEEEAGSLISYYNVKYAESKDGIQWKRDGVTCIDLRQGERNIGRPCVIKESSVYKLWYSYNAAQGYRIGYAESPNGFEWTRKDNLVGIGLGPASWDSDALAYPWIFRHNEKRFMLYNGNDFGKDGFGLAEDKS
jgi:predicted GH43/DUF377 family glycosyl hydrolase